MNHSSDDVLQKLPMKLVATDDEILMTQKKKKTYPGNLDNESRRNEIKCNQKLN